MRELEGGPFLKLQFYFADIPETEAFSRLIKALSGFGASFVGEGFAHQGEGVRNAHFAGLTDDYLESVSVSNVAELMQRLADPNIRLLQVKMQGAIAAERHLAEIVSYVYISPEAAPIDRHPLAILTEGWMFEGTDEMIRENAEHARRVGHQAYQRFRALVEALHPSYGAITVDWHLECPADLRHDIDSLAFQDFFVSREYLGESKIFFVASLFAGAYSESIEHGMYISCTDYFNPQEKRAPGTRSMAERRSKEVAKVIAAAG